MRPSKSLFAALCLLLIPLRVNALEGDELLGKPAPEWGEMEWLNSKPLKLADLRGKVILLRFWTDGCSLCAHTAPALNEFHDKYADRGLVVLGFYHSKPPRKRLDKEVNTAAEKLALNFPIARDDEWKYLNKLWLTRNRRFTSVTFLIDKMGQISFIHPGGEFFADKNEKSEQARSYAEIQRRLELLLPVTEK